MYKVGIFNCPVVKKNDYVEFVYNCSSIKGEEYKYRVIGKVIYIDYDLRILVELPKNFKKTGDIEGWVADDSLEIKYGCCKKKLYWWVRTYRIIRNKMEIE